IPTRKHHNWRGLQGGSYFRRRKERMGGIMTKALSLIRKCQKVGVTLAPGPAGRLRVRPPPERLPAELGAELKRHKDAGLAVVEERTRPYLTPTGELIIPFDCNPRYQWWAGGQTIHETLRELGAPPEILSRYVEADLAVMQ